ncbi:Sodium:dicarboxylate symporter [Sodiomyces alkalinus F11]|uniref:Amino acid transporter n=1 Tax=Sodiomyces alkalinus (strain CBS 110278 / VKM F-3762 / F11) TaxID=1314773 RepID=A0A3N2PJ37_SODAK|nr:Sodium:dicarboxylate symporter [Sodiomyces alkalinus F11]ROT34450.1 Sodium:dicarboxylate symporter [Sodiomyces alkalinus F11]
MGATDNNVKESSSLDPAQQPPVSAGSAVEVEEPRKPWWHPVIEPGSAVQIVIAAAIAVGIGIGVSASVDDIPPAAPAILAIPGNLWLRALRAVVLPMIICAMILAVQSLREITRGGAILARWTVGYYILTTIVAISFSVVMTSQVWAPLMTVASDESLDREANGVDNFADRENVQPHDVVVTLFDTLIPRNIVSALSNDDLLAVLVTSIVVGYLIRPDRDSSILRVVKEVNDMITRVIVFLIKLAPIGVFFLILPNMFRLDLNDVGTNLGYLIGGAISSMMIHLFVILPLIFFAFTRRNPYPYWAKSSAAWTTAWGTASSAATLPVTLRCARERGNPNTVVDFGVPLGCLINMDGTAIYFPLVVVFMAQTQGITLNAGDYILVLLLSTLASIGTTPIPSSSLVLTVMIATSVGVPLTGMYAVVVAIDWFLDRFRTMTNVSGDLFAAAILSKVTGITDPEILTDDEVGQVRSNTVRDNMDRV